MLYVNANTKTVGLSIQENIVLNRASVFGTWSIGDVVDRAAVTRVDQGLGLLLTISEGVLGFTHVRRWYFAGYIKLLLLLLFIIIIKLL